MEIFRKRHAVMCFIASDTVSNAALVPYPGSSTRPDLYRLDVPYDPEEESPADYPEARCLSLIRAAVGIADLPVRLKTVLTYEACELVADRFQQGRVFLVGDAARTQPPTGGLGGATGIAEAYNLTWKLAAVLVGRQARRCSLPTMPSDAPRRITQPSRWHYFPSSARPRALPGSQWILIVSLWATVIAREPSCGKTVMNIFPGEAPGSVEGTAGYPRRTSCTRTRREADLDARPVWPQLRPAHRPTGTTVEGGCKPRTKRPPSPAGQLSDRREGCRSHRCWEHIL